MSRRRGERALLLVGGTDPGDPFDWVDLDLLEDRAIATGRASRAQDLPATPAQRTVLAVPGSDVHVRRVALPAATPAQARAGAAFAFETVLASTTDIHFALGARQDSAGHRLVAAIAKARLSAWLEACARLDVVPQRVVVDFTLLSPEPHCAEALALGDRVLIGAGQLGGFAIEAPLAPAVLRQWLQDHPGVKEVCIPQDLAPLFSDEAFAPRLRVHEGGGALSDFALQALRSVAGAPDLRQEEFSLAPQKQSRLGIVPLAIAVAGVAALTQISANLIAGWRDSESARALNERSQALYRDLRPGVADVAALDASVRALANARANARNHPVLVLVDPLIAVQQAQPGVRLEAIRHVAPSGTVTVTFSAATPQPLEAAARSLSGEGRTATPGALRSEEGRYMLDLTIERTP